MPAVVLTKRELLLFDDGVGGCCCCYTGILVVVDSSFTRGVRLKKKSPLTRRMHARNPAISLSGRSRRRGIQRLTVAIVMRDDHVAVVVHRDCTKTTFRTRCMKLERVLGNRATVCHRRIVDMSGPDGMIIDTFPFVDVLCTMVMTYYLSAKRELFIISM